MSTDKLIKKVKEKLFSLSEYNLYMIVDGASAIGLLDHFDATELEYCCLLSGDLDPELAETAPYLIKLQADDKLTDWLIDEGWANHVGIFCMADPGLSFKDVRKHFRGFLMVRDAAGNPVFFRYYDPRVLRVYLPTCDDRELPTIYGDVVYSYFTENDDGTELLQFEVDDNKIMTSVSVQGEAAEA